MSDRDKAGLTLKINERHRRFAWLLVTDTATKAGDHYATVYGTQGTDKTRAEQACRLRANPNFEKLMEEIRAEIAETHQITVASLIAELNEIKSVALGGERPQCAAAVSAVMGKAKLAGLDKQVEQDAASATPVQVIIQVQDARADGDC